MMEVALDQGSATRAAGGGSRHNRVAAAAQ